MNRGRGHGGSGGRNPRGESRGRRDGGTGRTNPPGSNPPDPLVGVGDMEELTRNDPRLTGLRILKCSSREEALYHQNQCLHLPEEYFVRCHFVCRIDGVVCVVVDNHTEVKYPFPVSQQKDAISRLIKLGIDLDSNFGLVHANFKYCSGVLKFRSVPLKLPKTEIHNNGLHARRQLIQLFDIVDRIVVQPGQSYPPAYDKFRDYLRD